ncbi:unnamed protein product [Diamesa serratosioi]
MSSSLSDSPVTSPEKINTKAIKGRKSIKPTNPSTTIDKKDKEYEKSSSTSKPDPDLSKEIETEDEDSEQEKNQQNDKSVNNFKSSTELQSNEVNLSYQNDQKNFSKNVNSESKLVTEIKPEAVPKTDQNILKRFSWLIVIFAIVVCAYCANSEKSITSENQDRGRADCSAFLNLNQFQNQNKMLWKSLKSGIEGSFNEKPTKPSIFAFFSNDKNTMKSIMKNVVDITHKCTNSNENPINLTRTDLSSDELQKDHTKLILQFKEELIKREIMIINDVDKVPITVIPSLHSFCDIYNPLVEKSIIFLTIHVPGKPSGKPVEYIEEYLQDKWKDLKSNIRDPLITRILDQTFFLEKEDL